MTRSSSRNIPLRAASPKSSEQSLSDSRHVAPGFGQPFFEAQPSHLLLSSSSPTVHQRLIRGALQFVGSGARAYSADGRFQAARPNEKEKEIPMKKQAFALAVGLLVSIAVAGVCHAQQPVLGTNIPFAFQVGDKTLPAGEYSVKSMSNGTSDVQLIRQKHGDALTVVLTMAVDPKDGKSEPELIFNQYGNSYFLSQIWTGAGQGRELSKSKREKEAALGQARTEVALLAYPSSARP
jgi:hypothetical protein